jgi:hypothetical protein
MPQNNNDHNLFNEPYGSEPEQMDYSAYEAAEEEEEDTEDFPEPAAKAKPKVNVALIGGAAIGLLALSLGGLYVAAPETLRDMLPEDAIAMLPEGTFPAAEPVVEEPIVPKKRKRHTAPAEQPVAAENPAQPADQAAAPAEPAAAPAEQAAAPADQAAAPAESQPAAESAEWQAPAESQPAKPAAETKPKPKPVAAAPKPAAKPKPAPVAAKPKPAAKPAAVAGSVVHTTAIAFAPGSYWVAAAEVEKLWSISAKAGNQGGHFVVTTHRGRGADEGELLAKRTEKLVEMLRRNNRPLGHDVQVRTGAPAPGSTGHLDVSFVKQL